MTTAKKNNFPLNTGVRFVQTGSALDNQTGKILGKSIVDVEDHYIVMLDVPTDERLALCITEHCLTAT